MSGANGAAAGASGTGKGKKKGIKFAPLPGVHAVEESLPWHIEYSHKAGRHAVTDEDLSAGTLVLAEQPFCRVPLPRFAAAVCTRCLRSLNIGGEVPTAGNPCLPRYCPRCKELPNHDAQLAEVRIQMFEIAKKHEIDPSLLNLVAILDFQRSGMDVGIPPSDDFSTRSRKTFEDLRCTVADYDSLTNVWDKKSEAWRKKIGPAVRALHKSLSALSESGKIPAYKVSPITRLQADIALINDTYQTIATNNNNFYAETAIGLFPGLSVFHHACLPNCNYIIQGGRLLVRTLVDVPKGTQLTVSFAPVSEPRAKRAAILESERHYVCGCNRCTEPLAASVDRFLEGVICPFCANDVMLPVPRQTAAHDKAKEEFLESMAKVKELQEQKAARLAKKGGKGSKSGKKAAAPEKEQDEADAAEEEEAADPMDLPEGVEFWRCCSCNSVQAAMLVDQSGPQDVITTAQTCLERGIAYTRIKHPELVAQGEALLELVAGCMDGRLTQYHTLANTALMPLADLNLRKGENLKAMNYAINAWSVDRELNDGRPSMQQYACLERIIEAAESKASAVNSAVIKRQLEKKVKHAKEELKALRPVLFGI